MLEPVGAEQKAIAEKEAKGKGDDEASATLFARALEASVRKRIELVDKLIAADVYGASS